MSCSPTDLLFLAEKVIQNCGEDEVSSRCSISRAYYAALHSIQKTFPASERNKREDGESSHAYIIREAQLHGKFGNAGRVEASTAAKLMAGLRHDRNKADYHLDKDIGTQDATDAIARVKMVLKCCETVENLRVSVAASGS